MTKSVLVAEMFVAVHGFYFASTLRITVNDMFGRLIPLFLYTNSKSLFNFTVGLNASTEKRLLIDPGML